MPVTLTQRKHNLKANNNSNYTHNKNGTDDERGGSQILAFQEALQWAKKRSLKLLQFGLIFEIWHLYDDLKSWGF